MGDVEEIVGKMRQLKKFGVKFSVDDFGTGYSSLVYLKLLPFSQLKIDKSFIQDVNTDQYDAKIVETIIIMANHLGLDVIAEGVEKLTELEFLRERGCIKYQGYYFSKPLYGDEFTLLLKKSPKKFYGIS